MILAGEPLAVLDPHHLPAPWMERIEDPHNSNAGHPAL
ncbi:hypothetical protein ABIC03_007874 [Bradyrhizobium sp. RT6a]